GEQGVAVEGIDDQVFAECRRRRPRRASDEKMSREVDSNDTNPGAAGRLQIHERERNGNVRSSLQHLIKEAVAGVIIPLTIAVETLLVEEISIQLGDQRTRTRAARIDVSRREL